MPVNDRHFISRIEAFKTKSRTLATEVFQRTGAFAHERVVDLTPFKTGRLMSSWNLSLNAPNFRATEPGRRSEGTARQQALSSTSISSSAKLGNTIHIANGVEYADYVENGTPSTAPRLMMQRAVTETILFIRSGGRLR